MYEDPTIVDLVKHKSGAELFKELFRLLPSLSFEDYFKNGVWQNDLMRLDIEVIDAHRREAGAPDPPPMEEVKFPPLPGNFQAKAPSIPSVPSVPSLAVPSVKAAPALPPETPVAPAVTPAVAAVKRPLEPSESDEPNKVETATANSKAAAVSRNVVQRVG
mmetsp:Transcript_88843/g.141469  ORF Transcript_88843/g.141469 Transcript_88843/m.141469 type:complete len:161 (+) Transcript_88843:32-514(+)